MRCLSPISIRNPKGNSNTDRVTVPCGKCYACLSKRRSDWCFRLGQELKVASAAHFITLTYADDFLPRDENGVPCVVKRDCQLFFKKLRKLIYPNKIRYFLVSEYGTRTFRPHYHLILYNFPTDGYDIDIILARCWSVGFYKCGSVTGASINYVAKYCVSSEDLPDLFVPVFMLCSRRPAIGSNYLSRAVIDWLRSGLKTYVLDNGFKKSLPRYYRKKVYSGTFDDVLIKHRSDSILRQQLRDYYLKWQDYDSKALQLGQPSMQSQESVAYVERIRKTIKNVKKD